MPARWHWGGARTQLHIFLEPGAGRARRRRSVRPDPIGRPAARWRGSPANQGRNGGGGRRACAGPAGRSRRVAGQSTGVHLIRHMLGSAPAEREPREAFPRVDSRGRRRVHRGTPRLQPTLEQRPRLRSQHLPLRAAVQAGHRHSAAPVCHRPPRRAGQSSLATRRRTSLARIATRAGFSDQCQFSHQFSVLSRDAGAIPHRTHESHKSASFPPDTHQPVHHSPANRASRSSAGDHSTARSQSVHYPTIGRFFKPMQGTG